MNASSTSKALGKREQESTRSLLLRVLLVPLFVAVCYLFDWWGLRIATTATLLRLSDFLGLPMHRIGADLVAFDGMRVQFGIACTMVDAFFGAIPLLWRTRVSVLGQIGRLGIVFLGIFTLNITRLELGFLAMHHGAPWWLAHECVAGVAYFCLFLFIVREKAWEPQTDLKLQHNASAAPWHRSPVRQLSV